MAKIMIGGVVFLLIFTPIFKGGKEVTPLTFIELFIVILTIIYHLAVKKSQTVAMTPDHLSSRPQKNSLNVLLFCFVAIVSVATLNSIYFSASLAELVKIITYILLYYLVFNFINTSSLKVKMVNLIIALVTITALVGIYQHYQHWTVLANFPNANLMAGYLVVGITLSLSKLIYEIKFRAFNLNKGKNIIYLVLYFGAMLIMFLGLIYTESRGGLLSLFLVITFLSVMFFKGRGLIFVMVMLVLFSVFVPQDYVIKLLKLNSTDPYTFQRLAIWGSGLKAIIARPVLGWGPGAFGYIFYRYNFPVTEALAHYGKITRFTHNEFIQLGVEAGLIALVVLMFMLLIVFKKGRKDWYNKACNFINADDVSGWLIIAPLAGLVGILTQSLVDFNLHLPAIVILLVFFTAIIMNNNTKEESQDELPASFSINRVVPVTGLVLMAFLIIMPYVSYLYARGENYQKALIFNPLDSDYHEALGNLYGQKFKDSQDKNWELLTIQEYQKAIRLNPQYPYYYQDLADFYLNDLGSSKEAVDNYQKAIQLAPYDVLLYFNLASLYFNEGKFITAINMYQNTTEIEPNYLRAYYQMGIAYEQIGSKSEAFYAYNKIVNILHKNLSSKITSSYEKELLSLDTSLVYNRIGLLDIKDNKMEEAIANFRKALKINPDYAEAHNNLGGVYYQMGFYALAASEVGKALKIDPGNKMFQKNIEESLRKGIKNKDFSGQ
jgi:tetratricopeptide (TPR) repeat protein